MKKLIALLLVLVLAVSLVACANTGSSKGTIAVIAKGETHALWQAVKAGAEAAGAEKG